MYKLPILSAALIVWLPVSFIVLLNRTPISSVFISSVSPTETGSAICIGVCGCYIMKYKVINNDYSILIQYIMLCSLISTKSSSHLRGLAGILMVQAYDYQLFQCSKFSNHNKLSALEHCDMYAHCHSLLREAMTAVVSLSQLSVQLSYTVYLHYTL